MKVEGRKTLPLGAVKVRPMVRASTLRRGRLGASWRRRVDRTRRPADPPSAIGPDTVPEVVGSSRSLVAFVVLSTSDSVGSGVDVVAAVLGSWPARAVAAIAAV